MATPFNVAASAYGNAQKLIDGMGKGAMPSRASGSGGGDFARMLADNLQGVVDTGRATDQMSMDLLAGRANVVDVVTALSQTELAIDSMVTVRDRVISAYEEIMRMPI